MNMRIIEILIVSYFLAVCILNFQLLLQAACEISSKIVVKQYTHLVGSNDNMVELARICYALNKITKNNDMLSLRNLQFA